MSKKNTIIIRTQLLAILTGIFLLGLVGCSEKPTEVPESSEKQASKPSEKDPKAEEKMIEVTTEIAKKVPVFEPILFAGRIEPVKQSFVYSAVRGKLLTLRIKAGESVKRGQVLALIQPIGAAGGEFKSHAVLSPMTGTLLGNLPTLGSFVTPEKAVFHIGDISTRKIIVSATSEDLDQLRSAKRIDILNRKVVYLTREEASLQATVESISASVDPEALTHEVTLNVNCADLSTEQCSKEFNSIAINSIAFARIGKNYRKAIVFPLRIFNRARNRLKVAIKKDGKTFAEKRNVELGENLGGSVEILSGIDEGDEVITGSSKNPKDGTQVLVKNTETPSNSSQENISSGKKS